MASRFESRERVRRKRPSGWPHLFAEPGQATELRAGLPCIGDRHTRGEPMRNVLIGLWLSVLVLAAVAQGGGWATVQLSSLPTDLRVGDPWNLTIRVLQHGNPDTPVEGARPRVTLEAAESGSRIVYTGEPTGDPVSTGSRSSSPRPVSGRTPSTTASRNSATPRRTRTSRSRFSRRRRVHSPDVLRKPERQPVHRSGPSHSEQRSAQPDLPRAEFTCADGRQLKGTGLMWRPERIDPGGRITLLR